MAANPEFFKAVQIVAGEIILLLGELDPPKQVSVGALGIVLAAVLADCSPEYREVVRKGLVEDLSNMAECIERGVAEQESARSTKQ